MGLGIGEIAAMMYLKKSADRGSNDANRMRGKYNELVDLFNDLLAETNELRNKNQNQKSDINRRAKVVGKLLDERDVLQVERKGLNEEIETLKKTLASQEAWIDNQKKRNAQQDEWNEMYDERSGKQKKLFISQQETIGELTGQNSSLKKDLDLTKQELTQRVFVGETIRRGMHHIPVELRVKAAAESFVRNPDVSQAILSPDMPDSMKADIEMFVGLAMFPESGDKRVEIGSLYDQAKDKVKEDIAKSSEVFEKLIQIRDDMVQKAKESGEDPDKVPDIWTIQAEMKQKQTSGTKVTIQKDDDESYRQRM